jgi:hypothetical protein
VTYGKRLATLRGRGARGRRRLGCKRLGAGSWLLRPGKGLGNLLHESKQRDEIREGAVLTSLGCGNPTLIADLHEGETVLDIGSGGGIDVSVSGGWARRPRPTAST